MYTIVLLHDGNRGTNRDAAEARALPLFSRRIIMGIRNIAGVKCIPAIIRHIIPKLG